MYSSEYNGYIDGCTVILLHQVVCIWCLQYLCKVLVQMCVCCARCARTSSIQSIVQEDDDWMDEYTLILVHHMVCCVQFEHTQHLYIVPRTMIRLLCGHT